MIKDTQWKEYAKKWLAYVEKNQSARPKCAQNWVKVDKLKRDSLTKRAITRLSRKQASIAFFLSIVKANVGKQKWKNKEKTKRKKRGET